jgi:hypothetical protein
MEILMFPEPKQKTEGDPFSKISNADLKRDHAQRIAGNIKTLIITRFFDVVTEHVLRTIQSSDTTSRWKTLHELSSVIARFILGSKGKLKFSTQEAVQGVTDGLLLEDEEDTDTDTEPEESFGEALEKLAKRLTYKKEPLLNTEQSLFNRLKSMDVPSLRLEFLPPELQPLVDNWVNKLTATPGNVVLCWNFFAKINKEEFIQHLIPHSKAATKFVNLTTTRLAYIFCSYVDWHEVLFLYEWFGILFH